MTLQIPYQTKVNERLTGQSITAEPHIIGILNTATYSPGFIRLVEVPQAPAPLSSVSIPGYTEITSGIPTGMQFLVDYETGVITFNTTQDGNSITVSYIGLGSEFAAEDINELQNPLGTIALQSITYNWPSAPTVSWSLAANIVTPTSITNISTDDFTFPRDLFVTRNVVAPDFTSTTTNPASTGVIRLANSSDSVSWRNAGNTADLPLTVNGSNQLTFNGTPIELGTLTSAHLFVGNGSNVATDTAITGDVFFSNAGVTTIQPAVVTGSKIASATITNTNVASGTFAAVTGIGTQSQALNMNSHQINNVTDPSLAQDAATKNYVDATAITLPVSVADGGTGFSGPWGTSTIVLSQGTHPFDYLTNSPGILAEIAGFIQWVSGTAYQLVGYGSGTAVTPLTLAGTSNEIIITPSGTTITLSTPQAIATTSNVQFGELSLGGSADPSAILTLNSTTQGFLPPTMTTTQRNAISSPTPGLVIYNTTDNQWEGWNGSTWSILG